MSKIEWTDRTLNCFVGCRRVSQGCRHCYAEGQVHRKLSPQHRGLTVVGKQGVRWNGEVNYAPHRFDEMLRARKPQRWFINSLSDLFFEPVPFETIAALLGMMAVAHAWHGHTAQILTKRVERAKAFFDWLDAEYPDPRAVMQLCMGWFVGGAPEQLRVQSNVWKRAVIAVMGVEDPFPFWLGASVEDRASADARLSVLRGLPAAVLFASYEPALGGVDFADSLGLEWERCDACGQRYPDIYWGDDSQWEAAIGHTMCGTRCPACFRSAVEAMGETPRLETLAPPLRRLDWVIVGGESGRGARPFDLAWARSTIAQCREAGVPVFVKQLGAKPFVRMTSQHPQLSLRHHKGGDPLEWPEDLRVREFPHAFGGRA
ncbi:MAG: DUF5131 family protein [Sandaracinaceae bacterium]